MRNRILIGAILTVTILYWLVLYFKINIFNIISGYVWHFMQYSNKPLGLVWLSIPLITISYIIIEYILNHPEKVWQNFVCITLLGYAVQMSFGFMEGHGIDGLRQRMVTTGHAEFARLASVETDMVNVACHYEQLLDEAKSLQFVRSKPPGHLLFYMLTQKLSNIIASSNDPGERFRHLVTLAAYIYPLLAYLVIIPLYYFCRLFWDQQTAIIPCILYIFIPSVTLVTLHLDQVLYPFLFMLGLLLVLYSCRKESTALTVISGGFIFCALYFSFSLSALIPLSILLTTGYFYKSGDTDKRWSKYFKLMVGCLFGGLIVQLMFWIFLNYNIFERYQGALVFHESWKGWDSNFATTSLYALLNYIEFACWIGLPIAILYLSGSRRLIGESIIGKPDFTHLFSIAILLIFILLGFMGKAKSEVGRLWIFMMPLVCIFAVSELMYRFGDKLRPALWVLLGLQFISILVIKRFQDFW